MRRILAQIRNFPISETPTDGHFRYYALFRTSNIQIAMQCTIYKSSKKADLFLFVPSDTKPDTLNPAILAPFGVLQAVMTLDLSEDRRLARSDTATIRKHIQALGFHVQMPPGNENWAHWDNLKAGIRGQTEG